jgi:hypothetical protein
VGLFSKRTVNLGSVVITQIATVLCGVKGNPEFLVTGSTAQYTEPQFKRALDEECYKNNLDVIGPINNGGGFWQVKVRRR